MNIDYLTDFLETDTISVTFSSIGLKYLSLNGKDGEELINLNYIYKKKEQDEMKNLLIKETLRFLETGTHDMPLDLTEFTTFQQSVFNTTSQIEVGSICTYKGLADLLDNPGAAQAVGTAIAKNPVSYFIPTHRVLPQKGIGICKSGAGFLREKLLMHEGHDITKLKGNYICKRKKCCME